MNVGPFVAVFTLIEIVNDTCMIHLIHANNAFATKMDGQATMILFFSFRFCLLVILQKTVTIYFIKHTIK